MFFLLLVVPLKFKDSDSLEDCHKVFIKRYRSEKKTPDKPLGRTVTVLNIPPYATSDSVKRVFTSFGQVENVTLTDSFKNEHQAKYQIKTDFFNDDSYGFKFQIAFIVFRKSESVDMVLRTDSLPPLSTDEHPVLTGVAKWTEQYNKRAVDTDLMQTEIDEYMKHYDKVKKMQSQQGDADEDDGWTTVGKKGNVAGFKQTESVISKLELKMSNQKKKTKGLANFYSFEMRESKKQQLIELRKKFEQDKQKMQSMKLNRKFKPS